MTPPTRNELHRHISEAIVAVLTAIDRLLDESLVGPQPLAVVTGSAALWMAMYPQGTGPRGGDASVQEEKGQHKRTAHYWLPDDIDIAIADRLYERTVQVLVGDFGARQVRDVEAGGKFTFRWHRVLTTDQKVDSPHYPGVPIYPTHGEPEHPHWPAIQLYPVDDVIGSVANHDIEAVRCWAGFDGGVLAVNWCEGTDPERILRKGISLVFGAHRPLGCLLDATRSDCRFLNGIAPSPGAQHLVDNHPLRCPVGEKRVKKYRDRGFTLVPAEDSEPGTCPYCGATDGDPPEAQMVGMAGDVPTGEEEAEHAERTTRDDALRSSLRMALTGMQRFVGSLQLPAPPPLAEPTGPTVVERATARTHTEPVLILFETWTQQPKGSPMNDVLTDSQEREVPANHMWMCKHGDGVRTLCDGHLWVLYPENYVRGTDAIYKAVRYVDADGSQVQPLT